MYDFILYLHQNSLNSVTVQAFWLPDATTPKENIGFNVRKLRKPRENIGFDVRKSRKPKSREERREEKREERRENSEPFRKA